MKNFNFPLIVEKSNWSKDVIVDGVAKRDEIRIDGS